MTQTTARNLRLRSRSWVVLASLLYIGFLAALTPASVLAWVLSSATDGGAMLEGTEGRFWRGEARALVIVDTTGAALRIERPQWEWRLGRMLTGNLDARLRLAGLLLRGECEVSLGLRSMRLSHARFELPASSLAAYQPGLAPAGLSGQVLVQAEDFLFADKGAAGSASIVWRNAGSAWSSVNPLGEYRVRVTARATRAHFQVETISGVLRVEGRGEWSETDGLSFDGRAHGEASSTAELKGLLQKLGPDLGDSEHQLKLVRSSRML
jgi:general secretion pathway protein N